MPINFNNRIGQFLLKFLKGAESKKQALQGEWLSAGTYQDKVIILFKNLQKGKEGLSFLISEDGLNFALLEKQVVIESDKVSTKGSTKINDFTDFRLSNLNEDYYLTFSSYITKSSDLKKFIIESKDLINSPSIFISDYKHDGNFVSIYSDGSIKLALSKDLKSWYKLPTDLASPRGGFFDSSPLNLMGAYLTPKGILIIYDCSAKDFDHTIIQCGTLLLSLDQLQVIWRGEVPLFDPHLEEENSQMLPIGSSLVNNRLMLYWRSKNQDLLMISTPLPFSDSSDNQVLLTKFSGNPIITPLEDHDWESEGTFNPAAILGDGKVHIVYRAVGKNGISVFGYASSKDGLSIDERSAEPIYFPREEFEGAINKPANYNDFAYSGGSWGGCEDPKLTEIDDKIYMTYVSHNGYNLPRVTLTSIDKKDFYNKNWQWSKPVLISSPGLIDKSGCILPEKINGKYVIFHRIFPDILVDFVDSLEFAEDQFLKGDHKIPPRLSGWDSRKLSIGATPIKTDHGWLVIYHAIDDRDPNRYKIGAMILDKDDPRKVLSRTPHPILLPDQSYENEGKAGVAYPSGAVVLDNQLFVYYGGGDRVVCVATIPFENFLNYLISCESSDPNFLKHSLDFDQAIPWQTLKG